MSTPNTSMNGLDGLDQAELLALKEQVDQALASRGMAGNGCASGPPRSRACRFFTIQEGVRRLDKEQIEALARSFEAWTLDSRDARTRRSRERVFIIFLVLRYTGARLGEVLALDESSDIDFKRGLVIFPDGSGAREVPLPEDVLERIRDYCARYDSAPYASTLTGERLFDVDQGFIRRKFYEQKQRTGLPKELLNPRVLRNSRTIELLRGGMPMRVVQALLGHSKADFTSSYVALSSDDVRHMIKQHFHKEFGMATSARNTFFGDVTEIESNHVVCRVTLKTSGGYELTAVITNASREKLGLAEGKAANAMVKATWVVLEKADGPPATSARNAFPGVVTEVKSDEVATEVSGTLKDGTPVCALITTESFKSLDIGVGDAFIFMFKAMSVIIS